VDERQTQSEIRVGYEDEDDNEQTLRSSGTARKPMDAVDTPRPTAPAGGKKRRAAAPADDSDDGAVFKGFGTGRRKRSKQ
jgi:hypothetical protein